MLKIKKKIKIFSLLIVTLSLFCLFAYFSAYLDLKIAKFFLKPPADSWYFLYRKITLRYINAIYNWLTIPGTAIAITTFGYYLLSFLPPFAKQYKQYRRYFLFFTLNMLIGSGLIINGILKEFWGRPRPIQVLTNKTTMKFHPFYKPNFDLSHKYKSFPSGHSSTGFYFFSFYHYGRRRKKKKLAYFGLFFGLLFGLFIGLLRMMQSAHFLSDILAAGVVMWSVSQFFDYFLLSPLEKKNYD